MLSDKNYCVTICSVLALAAFVFVMRFLPDFVAWNGWELCSSENCNLQAWLGALSGWVGASVAAAAAVPLILQLREQRLQTAFSVGDAPPTIDALEHLEDSRQLVVRIVNWNRRAIVVHAIDAPHSAVIVFPNEIFVDGKRRDDTFDLQTIGVRKFTVRGWEDRGKPPHYAELRLEALSNEDLTTKENWAEIPRVVAEAQIMGEQHRKVTLSADTRLAPQ